MDKVLKSFSWVAVVLGISIALVLGLRVWLDGYRMWGHPIDYAVTGQFGDFVGGVIGTVFALAGTFLIYLALQAQVGQSNREAFESSFFEMIRLHKANVDEMRYNKFDPEIGEVITAENRRVFVIIVKEFTECFREVKSFMKSNNPDDYIKSAYRNKLESIVRRVNPKISITELALIDIAYSIVFYGVGDEGVMIMRRRFVKKYNDDFFYKLLQYMQLKPKRQNTTHYGLWKIISALNPEKRRLVINDIYSHRRNPIGMPNAFPELLELISGEFSKYYGGHQHRLGHYFRHLFQSYKFLDNYTGLSEGKKYEYGKMLRGQLSTYEQMIVFINSVSSMGMKWEYIPEGMIFSKRGFVKSVSRKVAVKTKSSGFITTYALIKNIPSEQLQGIAYNRYYPKIKFESGE